MLEDKKSLKARHLLDQYLNDRSKKPIWKDEDGPDVRYQFEAWVKDLPHERRTGIVTFVVSDAGKVSLWRNTVRSQKFLCVNGPKAGQRLTDEDAKGYLVFNCAAFNRGHRAKEVPSAVLVHRSAFKAPKKARRR